MGQALVAFAAGVFERARQTDRQGDRLRTGSPAVLLMASPRPRPQLHSPPHQECPNPFGSVEFVALIESVSTPSSWKETGTLPAACTASQ